MDHATLPALLGYDRSLLAQLADGEQRQIERLAEAWLLSSLLLACPPAYAAFLIEHSLVLALVLGAGMLFVVTNMLRLSVAGGGVSAAAEERALRAYTPALGATVVIGMLALLFAQPAQLPLWKAELDPVVGEYRQALIADHDRLLAALGRDASDPYRAELARCDFVVLRLTTIWKTPTRALQLTAFYLLVVLLPTLWARFVALDALRAYARARWQSERRLILRAHGENERTRSALLARFPSYTPATSPFADAPFDTHVVGALLAPPLAREKHAAKRHWLARFRARFARARTRALRPERKAKERP
jgi:hypothetical protein